MQSNHLIMKFITPEALKKLLDAKEAFQIIDTREAEKYNECHINSAVSIPQIELPERLKEIEKDGKVVIYCIYGMKSEQVYIYLKDKLKIQDLYILEGGIYQYARDIDPTMPV
jgi:rhodanese-related sulfurtransferase